MFVMAKSGGKALLPLPVKDANNARDNDDNNNKERPVLNFEGSKLTLEEFIKEWNARVLRRFALLENNVHVQYEGFEKLVKGKKLDSNLKKCTAFVRKMRQFQESYRSSLESDIRTLNLTKYISEIALVIAVELRLKPTDIPSLVSVCSEFHIRYRDFSKQLLKNYERILLSVTDLGSSPKLSTDLRLFVELVLAGTLPFDDAINLLVKTIQNLVSLDKDGSLLIPTLVNLLRDLTDELIGVIPRDVRLALEDHVCETQLKRSTGLVLKDNDKIRLKGTLKKYFHLAKSVFVKRNDKVWGSSKYLRKLMETKGEVSPDRQKLHDDMVSDLEKLHISLGKLANLLDSQTPKLRYLATNPDEEFENALLMITTEDGEACHDISLLFEDEETRQFYLDLPDLVAYMFEKKHGFKQKPSSGSFDKSKEPEESSSNESEKYDGRNEKGRNSSDDDDDAHSDSSIDIADLDSDFDETDSDSKSEHFDMDAEKADLMQENVEELSLDLEGDILPSMRDFTENTCESYSQENIPSSSQTKLTFNMYLGNLKNCVSKTITDKAAFDFVDNFKSKRCRKELAKHLFSIPRQRMDLLRQFSRLIASVSQVYPDIGQEICELLRKDFRFLVLKRDQQRLESKLRITRFIGELTIFSVLPKSEAFNCLKMLLRNFTHHQIEMACCFLETCGRFLYLSRESHRRMKLYLEEMLRRKTSQFMEPCYAYKIDSAYNQACPPRVGPKKSVPKSPLHAYMDYVLCFDLNRDTLERANKVLRMFDWKDATKCAIVVNILSCPWRLNYSQLDAAGALLASLEHCRPSVTQAVIENLSEVIRLGCEFESEDINSMRMSTCQYIAHLYNYKCITTTSLLNVMYYLISYGVTYQNDVFSTMDPPDSLYRIRVVCNMLRIVGDFVSTPKSNRRLDFFLKYFQRYYLYKRGLSVWEENSGRKQFPHYVEEMFEDTLRRVRENWKFVKTVNEAEQDILELDKKLRERVKNNQVKRAISGERKSVGLKVSLDVKTEIQVTKKPPNYAHAAAAVCQQQYACHRLNPNARSLEPASVVSDLKVVEEESESEKEDEFEMEFQAMCSESNSLDRATGLARKTDVPAAKVGGSRESGMDALSYGLTKVKVTVLTKRNNRPREKTLEIETKEDFLMSIKEREEQEKKEKQEVKTRTLQLSRRQQEEEQREKDRGMMQALWKLGKVAVSNSGKRNQKSYLNS